ncbi:Conserved_hypothetical protein [Hexamita inflata]|uniref:Uncharacterized protein n=1 Tax=Hexamita inflata TaxID=28002 RepID=A0AA86QCX8_9EUKA|nr:Conserved hypothetical protein [Hexamita inflata]
MNNLTSDGIETLKGCRLPLSSFSFIGLYGSPGCGKTTQLQNIADAVIQWSKQTTYDLDKPKICNGVVTHYIYISPSTQTDHTLNSKDNKILIQGTDQNILDLTDSIKVMNDAFESALISQDFIRDITKDIYKELYEDNKINQLTRKQLIQRHPQYNLLIRSLQSLEQFKENYPELRFKETNKQILQVLSDITSKTNMLSRNSIQAFDGFMVRRPKIILIADDQAGTKLFTSITSNEFYNLLCVRRHQSLFFIGISLHSPGNMQYSYKMQMNSMLLFRGIPQEKLKLLYDNISALDSIDFNINDFIKIYQNATGYNETDMSKKEDYRFNFVYVQSQPIQAIYLNFDKRLK